ncbi:MAG TPA: hypothetical protein PKV96_01940 [Candidatus Saccharimonas sp.]|jgi:hypothetical protein|nr:hypothetical protein [Candidatus Saccharimonas sp.]
MARKYYSEAEIATAVAILRRNESRLRILIGMFSDQGARIAVAPGMCETLDIARSPEAVKLALRLYDDLIEDMEVAELPLGVYVAWPSFVQLLELFGSETSPAFQDIAGLEDALKLLFMANHEEPIDLANYSESPQDESPPDAV